MGDLFASTRRKLEDLPSDGGHAVDVLAGANLRIFVRLKELEGAYADLRARLRVIEERHERAKPPVHSEPKRTRVNGEPDLRGASSASRWAARQARTGPVASGPGLAKAEP